MKSIRWTLLLGLLVLAVGCNPGVKMADVKGNVSLDGKPMPSGQVMFDAGDGTVPPTLDVVAGAFSGKASVGKKTIRISSYKNVAQKGSGPGAEAEGQQNIIPAKFNTESKQTVEVKEAGPNQFEFKVASQ